MGRGKIVTGERVCHVGLRIDNSLVRGFLQENVSPEEFWRYKFSLGDEILPVQIRRGNFSGERSCPGNWHCIKTCRPMINRLCRTTLSPVHTSNNVEATFDFVAKNGNNVERGCRKISSFRLCLFDKIECCFDIVAVLATLLPKSTTLLPKTATMWKQHLTLSKESFDL